MVANNLTRADVEDPAREAAFPESVVSLFRGELGFPPDGFLRELSRKVLRGDPPPPFRPGDTRPAVDLDEARAECEKAIGRRLSDTDLASHLMYPKVFREYAEHQRQYSETSALPTRTFFYGMRNREEILFAIDAGKSLVVQLQGKAPAEAEWQVKLFFELSGQPRMMRVKKIDRRRASGTQAPARREWQPRPCAGAHAGHGRHGVGQGRAEGEGRRPAGVDRGDEDAAADPQRSRRCRQGGPREVGRHGRRPRPAARARLIAGSAPARRRPRPHASLGQRVLAPARIGGRVG